MWVLKVTFEAGRDEQNCRIPKRVWLLLMFQLNSWVVALALTEPKTNQESGFFWCRKQREEHVVWRRDGGKKVEEWEACWWAPIYCFKWVVKHKRTDKYNAFLFCPHIITTLQAHPNLRYTKGHRFICNLTPLKVVTSSILTQSYWFDWH